MAFYKVMWLPDSSLVWNMKTEFVDERSKTYEDMIRTFIDLDKWKLEYEKNYSLWLANDDDKIFDLSSDLIDRIRRVIKKVNETIGTGNQLFYWYDVDRDKYEKHKWTKSPLSNKELTDLGEEYPSVNRMISLTESLCFPQ